MPGECRFWCGLTDAANRMRMRLSVPDRYPEQNRFRPGPLCACAGTKHDGSCRPRKQTIPVHVDASFFKKKQKTTNINSLYIFITRYYRPFSFMYFTFKVVFNSFAVQLYNIAQYHKSALQRQIPHHTSVLCPVNDHHLMFNQLAHRDND